MMLVAAAATMSACAGSTDSDSVAVGTSAESTTIVQSATTVPATTAETTTPTTASIPEPTTSAAVVTSVSSEAPPIPVGTAPPESVAPTLRVDGIGPLVFATTTPEAADAYLAPLIGAPVSVVSSEYPDASGTYYENDVDESGFTFPFGRAVCYGNGLCTHFGGADAAALSLVGFHQTEAADSLSTASGVTAGSPGTDFPTAIVTEPGGCFSTGGGTADGVGLFLQSSGTWFTVYDDATGEYVHTAPPVAEVTVLSVSGGDKPYYLYDDC